MDPTARFFAKLRKVAVTLESETAKLLHDFENRNSDDDGETTARAMRAYHELNCDVGNLKGQIQEQLAQQKARETEVSEFLQACRVMKQRVSQDIHTLRSHWENYGYQAPQGSQRPKRAKSQESDAEDEEADWNETKSAGGEGESQEEAGDNFSSSSPKPGLLSFTDLMRTPQLSDFGLSEMQLKRALAGAEWCSEVPPMPEMSLPHPSLNTPAPPPMPITPKCALRMDDDELQTPQMHDFGISEHTTCQNNDFTMDLFCKNVERPPRPPQDIPVPPVNSLIESLQAKADTLESPEPPQLCTPGFKIKKTNNQCSLPAQCHGDPESPVCSGNLPTTPEVPAFQTPYLSRQSARLPEPISKCVWEYNVPEISILGLEEKQMPEMPNLESMLGNSLQTRSAKMLKNCEHEKETKEPIRSSLELDGPTQEFSLGTPRIRMDFQEPSTPEMPDLSSVTQDICKLVSQAQLKKPAMGVVHPQVSAEKENCVSVVSKSEFQSLPSYLRRMGLHNLNQAIHDINKFTAEYPREKTEFQMEELKKLTNFGAKTPVYIICLTELKRLTPVEGARDTYKLNTHN